RVPAPDRPGLPPAQVPVQAGWPRKPAWTRPAPRVPAPVRAGLPRRARRWPRCSPRRRWPGPAGVGTPTCCWPSGTPVSPPGTGWTCRCPTSSRCPRWSPWPVTRPSWPARSAAPCRTSRPRARGPCQRAPLARRGTAFHAWLEERYNGERLLDLDELPGAADDGAAPDADLELLQQRFLASGWADRVPAEVEVPFEALLGGGSAGGRAAGGGVLGRGRVDPGFARPPPR